MDNPSFQKVFYSGENNIDKYEDEILKINKIRLKKIKKYIAEEGKNKKILELGCATGLISQNFTKENEVYGADIVDAFLAVAKTRGIKTVKANLEQDLPFKTGEFDLIIASEIIEHVLDTDKLLSECNRLLKKGGKMVISIPNLRNPFSPWLLLFFNHPPVYSARYRSPHVRDFTYPFIKKALRNNGFNIVKKTGSNFYLPKYWQLANTGVSSLFGRLFPTWSKEIIIKAEKTEDVTYDPGAIFDSYQKGKMI